MKNPPLILIVEDNPAALDILKTRLITNNYDVATAIDGQEGLEAAKKIKPDLILLDVMMPKMDGIEVCKRLKNDDTLPFIPIIMVTAKAGTKDIVNGLEAGSDEYLTKPVDHTALIARVKSMLRIKFLHDQVQEQADQLKTQAAQLENWGRTLEQRVNAQVKELEKSNRLKRFLSPQLAELVVSSENEDPLKSHRRKITVVFCDLRGFTTFAETEEPEEVMGVLREYHEAMGKLIYQFEGTLERFTGDGLMVFFNDPIPCENPSERAVKMAIKMREKAAALSAEWLRRDYRLGFGVGIANGYATLGKIGFEGRFDYAAIGTVTNLASRLCDEAKADQILISQRVFGVVEEFVNVEQIGEIQLKGLSRPFNAFNVISLKN